ncbi:MAG: HAD-IC family P-type ATPase, partial [Aquabacterium sp.]
MTQAPIAAHTLDAQAVATSLDVGPDAGLGAQEALARLARFGPNRLPQAPARSPWRVLLAQFKSILILVLLGAVVLAALVGSTKDAVVILAVVVINALVGFYQEYRAERSLAALKSMLPSKARVRRDGVSQEVTADDLVPGDVLLLEAGDRVAADGRLLLAAGLEIDESALTGESQPVAKQSDLQVATDAPLGDRLNLAYMNTLLTRGRAELLVTATGASTEMGRLSQELAATEEVATPLQVQLDRLGKRLGAIALVLVGLLSFLQFLRGADLVHI